MFELTSKYIAVLVLFTASRVAFAHPGHGKSGFHTHGFEFIPMSDYALGFLVVAVVWYLCRIALRKAIRQGHAAAMGKAMSFPLQ